jgi:hypothetical protein
MRIELERRNGYILMRVPGDTRAIDAWLRERDCGKCVALNRYKINTDEDLTMLKLAWSDRRIDWVETIVRYH